MPPKGLFLLLRVIALLVALLGSWRLTSGESDILGGGRRFWACDNDRAGDHDWKGGRNRVCRGVPTRHSRHIEGRIVCGIESERFALRWRPITTLVAGFYVEVRVQAQKPISRRHVTRSISA